MSSNAPAHPEAVLSLKDFLVRQIQKFGPLRLDAYMHLCLMHPQWGYYQRPTPIGAKGAFTTAPEISQMFGEMIGAWMSDLCSRIPPHASPLNLIELGPGRGTLMVDLLKIQSIENVNVHLIEQSESLKKIQQKNLLQKASSLQWYSDVSTCFESISSPFILIANEFLDALPVRQFQWTLEGWRERLVTVTHNGSLSLGLDSTPVPWIQHQGQKEGDILELCPEAERLIQNLCTALEKKGGAALFIDYGASDLKAKLTLQALKDHKSLSILEAPGESDLTAHVNFGSLEKIVKKSSSTKAWPLLTQGGFLLSLGLKQRSEHLAKASPRHKAELDFAVQRLTNPEAMGMLFKVWILTSKNFPIPEPFFSQRANT
ncbi:MAG: class I SAM-dependent methyltransferase [bacterium]|nr:class I SAM-dependent methyltransferase [bacterium]